jgi:hypothetical protein
MHFNVINVLANMNQIQSILPRLPHDDAYYEKLFTLVLLKNLDWIWTQYCYLQLYIHCIVKRKAMELSLEFSTMHNEF